VLRLAPQRPLAARASRATGACSRSRLTVRAVALSEPETAAGSPASSRSFVTRKSSAGPAAPVKRERVVTVPFADLVVGKSYKGVVVRRDAVAPCSPSRHFHATSSRIAPRRAWPLLAPSSTLAPPPTGWLIYRSCRCDATPCCHAGLRSREARRAAMATRDASPRAAGADRVHQRHQ
jgi:hypothetical protein